MINFYNQVPSVYPNASRDFQYLSWLINIVLNSVKHNVDSLYNLPNVNFDSKLSELFALTLGFKIKRNYDKKQLAALAAILPSILKYKGTEKAIEMAAEALITASGALGDIECDVVNSQLQVKIPRDITIDTTLFLDLLDYILPAGMTCRIIREDRTERDLYTYVKHNDKVYYDIFEDLDWNSTNSSYGLSSLFNLDTAGKAVNNYITRGSLLAVDLLTNAERITVENYAAQAPTWTITATHGRISLQTGDTYLAHVIEEDIHYLTLAKELAEWAICQGEYYGTFRFEANTDNYYLAYNNSTNTNPYFCAEKLTSDNTFDFYVYKSIDKNERNSSIYKRVLSIDEIMAGGEFVIVAQNLAPEFTANFKKSGNGLELNTGLLFNTVIPVIPGKEIIDDNTVELLSTEFNDAGDIIGYKVLYADLGKKIKLRAMRNNQEL